MGRCEACPFDIRTGATYLMPETNRLRQEIEAGGRLAQDRRVRATRKWRQDAHHHAGRFRDTAGCRGG